MNAAAVAASCPSHTASHSLRSIAGWATAKISRPTSSGSPGVITRATPEYTSSSPARAVNPDQISTPCPASISAAHRAASARPRLRTEPCGVSWEYAAGIRNATTLPRRDTCRGTESTMHSGSPAR
ncbi:hypothetical protein GCM10020254_23340 [Streptomyces goshikiensis]